MTDALSTNLVLTLRKYMPNVLIYEYLCSCSRLDTGLSQSLAAEGRAMLVALAADLLAASCRTVVIWDQRHGEFPLAAAQTMPSVGAGDEQALFASYAPRFDWTIVIAPETGGLLAEHCRWVETAGGRLLGCSAALVELLSEKQRTAEYLAVHGVAVSEGQTWQPREPPPNLPCPVIVKPRDGAGSQHTFLVEDQSALREVLLNYEAPARIEKFIPGAPCSVSFLCGPRGCVSLAPGYQRIGFNPNDEHLPQPVAAVRKVSYLGGRLPLPPHLSLRAIDLATRAVKTLREPLGYVGVDLILDDSADGRGDSVIEVNPRLTTSYIGLRAACSSNLAQAMLDVADGRPPTLSFNSHALEFDADGSVRPSARKVENLADPQL